MPVFEALVKARLLGYARSNVEELILAGHDRRGRNTGAADWLVRSGRLMVAYNSPATDKLTTTSSPSGDGRSPDAMKIDGHCDPYADIAWLRFEDQFP